MKVHLLTALFLWMHVFLVRAQPVVNASLKEQIAGRAEQNTPVEHLAALLATDTSLTDTRLMNIHHQIAAFCAELSAQKKDNFSDRRYLQLVFTRVQETFFRQYQPFPPFYRLFTDGTYNCVSGTALYALILRELGYTVQIYETAFHTYLTVSVAHRVFLLDATDADNGFVMGTGAIRQREALYADSERKQQQPLFNRKISLTELSGLHFYNEATLRFNQQAYTETATLLTQAATLYPRSERIQRLLARAQNNRRNDYAAATAKRE